MSAELNPTRGSAVTLIGVSWLMSDGVEAWQVALFREAASDEGQNHENKERNKGDKYDQ